MQATCPHCEAVVPVSGVGQVRCPACREPMLLEAPRTRQLGDGAFRHAELTTVVARPLPLDLPRIREVSPGSLVFRPMPKKGLVHPVLTFCLLLGLTAASGLQSIMVPLVIVMLLALAFVGGALVIDNAMYNRPLLRLEGDFLHVRRRAISVDDIIGIEGPVLRLRGGDVLVIGQRLDLTPEEIAKLHAWLRFQLSDRAKSGVV